jgi:hypothetical protein
LRGKAVARGFLGIFSARGVLTGLTRFLGNELPPPLVNKNGERKFVKCYVRAPERDANLKRNPARTDPFFTS